MRGGGWRHCQAQEWLRRGLYTGRVCGSGQGSAGHKWLHGCVVSVAWPEAVNFQLLNKVSAGKACLVHFSSTLSPERILQ